MNALAIALLLCAPAGAAPKPDPVDRLLARLSVEEKVGQLFMIALDTEIAARYEPMIRAGKLGGAFERWDKFTGDESRAFAAQLRTWTDSSPNKVPVLIAADHEGGAAFTQRRYGGVVFPGNMALGAAGSADLARRAAAATARELRSWSVDVDFAPSVDVNNNPGNPIIGLRSFGDDPALVSRLGVAAIEGYLSGGAVPAAKHFPGHGNAATDSHLELPVIAEPLADWEKMELPPFRAAVGAGVPIVMTAHIVLTGLDPSLPVTLSSAALQGVLRRRLGFTGVAVSDALDMNAIAKTYGTPEAALRSFLAGCDILLTGKGDYPGAYERVLAAAKDGTIPRERLDASARRILRVKRRARLFSERKAVEYDKAADEALAARIAERAATLLKNDGVLPLKLRADQKLLVVAARSGRFEGDAALLEAELKRRHANTELIAAPIYPKPDFVEQVAAKASTAAVVVLGTFQLEALSSDKQAALYGRLRTLGKPIVVASLMNPYDLARFPDASAMTASYGVTPASMRALARLLFGEIKPRGRLPVSIPGLFPRGSGLSKY